MRLKDLQELVTIYRTTAKTCVRGSVKESDVKEFVLAHRLMLKLIPKFRKTVLDTIYDGCEFYM